MSEAIIESAGESVAADTTSSGVTEFVSTSGHETAAESPTATETNAAPSESTEASEGQGTAPPEETVPDNLSLDSIVPEWFTEEKAREAFTRYRVENKELSQYKQQLEPVYAAIQERGGFENVRKDLQAFDAIWSDDANVRATFHQALYQESPQAYERFVGDLISDPVVQTTALQSLGLNPELVDLYRQVTESGQLPQTAAPAQFPTEWLDQIKPEYRSLLNSLDPEIQADFALRDPKVANFDLANIAQVKAIEESRRQEQAQAQMQAQQQMQAQIEQAKDKAYTGIRDVVKSEVAKIVPDAKLQEILTNSAEAGLLKSPKGEQLWKEIEAAIEAGETRTVRRLTPLIVAEATVQVQQELREFASIHEKARKYDELMRGNASRDVPAGNGERVSSGNGKLNMPNPGALGKYDPANIMAYFNS